MSDGLDFRRRHFPSRVADLGFSVRLPADWIVHELPDQETDFGDGTAFHPLAVVTAPHAVIVLAFGGRPAYDDGTLLDWTQWLVSQNGITPRAMGSDLVAGLQGMIVEGTKEEPELGTMIVRCAFIEDGGRLINLTYSAPEQLDSAVHRAWWTALQSFALETPRTAEGAAFRDAQLAGEGDSEAAAGADSGESDGTAEDAEDAEEGDASDGNGHGDAMAMLAALREEVGDISEDEDEEEDGPVWTFAEDDEVDDDAEEEGDEGDDVAEPDESPPGFADFALDDDIETLDPEHPVNAALRDKGAGFVPRVVSVHTEERRANVAALALVAEIGVPFGWHVLDDGRRTLVFDADGAVQVNLSYLAREGRDDEAILDAIEGEARTSYPSPEFVRLAQDGMSALGIRGIEDDGVQLEQYHLIVPGRDDAMVLRARVTARPEHAVPATNMAELILQSVVHLSGAQPAYFDSADAPKPERLDPEPTRPAGPPEWWTRAVAHQKAGEMKAAEQLVRDHVPHLAYAITIAELWALRMEQLEEGGDSSGADAAYREARDWAYSYAASATSGGEGAALSLQRDDFVGELSRRLGREVA